MMRVGRTCRVLAAGFVLTTGLATADAQTVTGGSPQRARTVNAPAAPRSFLRAYFLVDGTEMRAADTFDAIVGTSRFIMPGGGAEVLGLWKGLFARVAFSNGRETGSRVVVFDDEVVSLGIPVTIEMRPIEIGAGWRLRPFAARRLVPYAGAGLLLMNYKETSEFADTDDDSDETYRGAVAFGGIEAVLGGWLVAGAEAQYRLVPDAIGSGGVSAAFGEDDLGGVTLRVLVGVRR